MGDIIFEYEKKSYKVPEVAYIKGRIVLPDGQLFNVIWDECTCPHKVRELVPVDSHFTGASAKAIALIEHAEEAVLLLS